MRDVINKGVSEEDLLAACSNAFKSGWNTVKLYFMMGLPTETDEDWLVLRILRTRCSIYTVKLQGSEMVL